MFTICHGLFPSQVLLLFNTCTGQQTKVGVRIQINNIRTVLDVNVKFMYLFKHGFLKEYSLFNSDTYCLTNSVSFNPLNTGVDNKVFLR